MGLLLVDLFVGIVRREKGRGGRRGVRKRGGKGVKG